MFGPLLFKIIEHFITDPNEQDKLKLQLQDAINAHEAGQVAEADAQSKSAIENSKAAVQVDLYDNAASIVKTEVVSDKRFVSYCRPMLMYLFMIIIGVNYLIIPAFRLIFPSLIQFPMPDQMWTLINVYIGIYGGGQSLEKIATVMFDNKKFMDVLQSKMGKLTAQQRMAVNDALSAAEQPSE